MWYEINIFIFSCLLFLAFRQHSTRFNLLTFLWYFLLLENSLFICLSLQICTHVRKAFFSTCTAQKYIMMKCEAKKKNNLRRILWGMNGRKLAISYRQIYKGKKGVVFYGFSIKIYPFILLFHCKNFSSCKFQIKKTCEKEHLHSLSSMYGEWKTQTFINENRYGFYVNSQ